MVSWGMEKVICSIPLGRMVLWVLVLRGVIWLLPVWLAPVDKFWHPILELSFLLFMVAPLGVAWFLHRGIPAESGGIPHLRESAFWLLLLTSGSVLTSMGVNILTQHGLYRFFPDFYRQMSQVSGSPLDPRGESYGLWLFIMVVAAPFTEEFLFRGVFLGRMRRFGFRWSALVVSSLVFALGHGDLRIPGTFFLGLSAAWAVVKTGKFSAALWIHGGQNLFSALLSILPGDLQRGLRGEPWVSLALGAGGLGILALVFFFWPLKEEDWDQGKSFDLPGKMKNPIILFRNKINFRG